MAEEVKYEMSLNDLVSGKLDLAEEHAKKFETRLGSVHSTLDKLGEMAVRVGERLGFYELYEKTAEFFEKGTEMVEQQDIAVGQLENTLRNVGERAGMTANQLVSMAERIQEKIPFTTAEIVDMENSLAHFGNMTPGIMQKTLAMSADIAVSLKRNAVDVATQLGRIMEAPAENARLLRDLGVTLTDQDRKYVMQLERTGKVAKAQTFIFQELATKGYGGAAAAAAKTNPLFAYNKIIYDLQINAGKLGIAFEENLAPALEFVGNKIKEGYHYVHDFSSYLRDNLNPILKEVKNDAYALGAGMIVAGAGFLFAYPQIISYTGALIANGVATFALTGLTYALTAAQWLFNIAASANPIGALVVTIGAVTTGIIIAYHHFTAFRAVLDGIGEVVKDLGYTFNGLEKTIIGALTFNPAIIKQGLSDMAAGAKDIGAAFHRGYTESMAESKLEDDKKHESTMGKMVGQNKKGPTGVLAPKAPGPVSKVTGSKVLHITVNIGALVKEMKIETTNFKEGVSKAQSMVTDALLMAVNDSQLAAGE